MPRNEADTRALLIEPKLQAAGWSGTQVTREHFYRRDQAYTAGRIYLRGDRARRGEPLALLLHAAGDDLCVQAAVAAQDALARLAPGTGQDSTADVYRWR